MVGSQFLGEVTMQGNLIGEALLLGFVKTESRNHINKSKNYFNVHFCEVGTILDIRGAKFGSELDLTGTKVDSLLCGRGDVPPQLKLDRFTYNHLGGIGWKTPPCSRVEAGRGFSIICRWPPGRAPRSGHV